MLQLKKKKKREEEEAAAKAKKAKGMIQVAAMAETGNEVKCPVTRE